MNIDKYIEKLSASKLEIEGILSQDNIPSNIPYLEAHEDELKSPANTAKNASLTCLSLGVTSLVVGLIVGKTLVTSIGAGVSALSLGGLYYASSVNKGNMENAKDASETINFQLLNNEIFSSVSKNINNAIKKWDETLQANKRSLNTEILSSTILTEEKKTKMLSLAAKEESLSLQISDLTLKLRQLTSSENLEGIRQLITSFQKDNLHKLNEAYQKQIEDYTQLKDI